MKISTSLVSRILKFTSCAVLMTYSSFTLSVLNDSGVDKVGLTNKVHGEGKKAIDCDMTQIAIRHNETVVSVNINNLITLTPKGVVEDAARRTIKKGKPVLPVFELFRDYPGTLKVAFGTCGTGSIYKLTKSDIEKNKKIYMLTLNRVGRARLVKFEKHGSRGRYNTVAKNIISITLSQ